MRSSPHIRPRLPRPDRSCSGRSRRSFLASVGTGLATLVAGCTGGEDADPIRIEEDFEDGLDGWAVRSHVGSDAGGAFRSEVTLSDEHARSGERSLRLFTGGEHDDGTAWVVRDVAVTPDVAYDATVTVHAWSASESFNTLRHLVAFLGPYEPVVEEDFPAAGENSSGTDGLATGGLREPLDLEAGWRSYSFTWRAPPVEGDRLWLAVGVSVVWETDRADFLDDVAVELVPRQ